MAEVINTKDKADDASKCSSESKVYKPLQASCFFSKTIQTIKKTVPSHTSSVFFKKKSIEPYKLVQEHSFCASQEIRLLWEH